MGLGLHFEPGHNQWASLTALYRVPCLWKPSHCTSGATVAVWIKTSHVTQDYGGIFSTMYHDWRRQRWIIGWTPTGNLQYILRFVPFPVFTFLHKTGQNGPQEEKVSSGTIHFSPIISPGAFLLLQV